MPHIAKKKGPPVFFVSQNEETEKKLRDNLSPGKKKRQNPNDYFMNKKRGEAPDINSFKRKWGEEIQEKLLHLFLCLREGRREKREKSKKETSLSYL